MAARKKAARKKVTKGAKKAAKRKATKRKPAKRKPTRKGAKKKMTETRKNGPFDRDTAGNYICSFKGCDNPKHKNPQGIGHHLKNNPTHRTPEQTEFSKATYARNQKNLRAAKLRKEGGLPLVMGSTKPGPKANFCTSCGTDTHARNGHYCPRCGDVSKAGWSFCPGCGTQTVVAEETEEAEE